MHHEERPPLPPASQASTAGGGQIMERTDVYTELGALDLILVIAITCMSIILTEAEVGNVALRAVFALPLVLVLPGYALLAAACARSHLGIAEQVLFSLGLSLATTAVGGALLNWSPWGLQTDSWALLLGVVTLGASAVALKRRSARPTLMLYRLRPLMHGRQAALVGLAALVLGSAIAMGWIGAARQQTPGFTQLWALPASAANQHHAIRLGVKNMEATTMTYEVDIVVNGKDVVKLPHVQAAPQHTWQTTVALPGDVPTGALVDVVLYRASAPGTAYRHVDLWLTK